MSYASTGRQRSQVEQPKGQKRLTNVAIVRLKKGGCRFEVACYKNKVVNWRNRVETQLDEVLQSHDVFVNVSKGKRATADDMRKVFGTDDVDEVAKLIIDQGELQVSDGERAAFNQSLFQEIATIVVEKCVNPESNRPYPFSVIERVMKEIHYSLIPNRSAKQQALDVIGKLQDHMPITRAKMKVQVSVPAKDGKSTKKYLEQHNATVLDQKGTSDTLRLICLIDPGAYRGLDAFVANNGDNIDGARSLEVLELSCHEEGEHSIDAEISKKTERFGMATGTPPSHTVLPPPLPAAPASNAPAASAGRPCSTCGGAFTDTAVYREHFRSEWHRYNLKLKAKKRPSIDQAAFDQLSAHDVQRFFETLD
ncbi:SBDS family rRNA metabolism protein [Aphanomyces invadans]|uniref:SBDS family rRNA metabolism protein n=1 Tax=Aphanomyces invadans TaxID=157072 RepID=A0A024TES8_9STRA|nr:SBDS family rRNA metabolism protein [Aphanomyces invadans]ETV92665.1 SBDS family rRNA metabolism protein [Aphanomyces invadans]|eukprot:XP_008878701.1 SBDS family rRNA metabolism protein [Aphanomyces invadans]